MDFALATTPLSLVLQREPASSLIVQRKSKPVFRHSLFANTGEKDVSPNESFSFLRKDIWLVKLFQLSQTSKTNGL